MPKYVSLPKRKPCPNCGSRVVLKSQGKRWIWFCRGIRHCAARGPMLSDGYLAIASKLSRLDPKTEAAVGS